MRRSLFLLVFLFALFSAVTAENYKFDDYTLFIRLSGSLGYTWGDLIQQEQDSWELSVQYGDGTTLKANPKVSQVGGFEAEVEWKFKRIGIPVRYRLTVYNEDISVGDDETYQKLAYTGKLLFLHTVSSGIRLYFGASDMEEVNQYSAWYVGLRLGADYAYLMPYPTLLSFLETQPVDSWGLIGATAGPELGFNYIFGAFLIGVSVQANGHFLWTPDSLRDYYQLDNIVWLGDVAVSASLGLAF